MRCWKKNFPFKGLGPLIKGGGSAESPYQSDSLLVGVCVPKSVRGKHCNYDDEYIINNDGKDRMMIATSVLNH